MFSKKQWICVAVFVQSLSALAQVSINNDLATPHASAMLDVKSTNKGMLVPRMTTAQRNNIAAPATGLLVFDSDLNRFYFFNGTNWGEIGAITPQFIADADGNTSVHTETNSNEDMIRFKIGGGEKWRMIGNRLECIDGNNGNVNIFLGYNSGSANESTNNTFIGHRSGQNNTTGGANTFLGSGSGQNNTTGTANIFLGGSSGTLNTTGRHNVFLGYSSGGLNTTGSNNMFSGNYAGNSNTTGGANTFLGYSSGYHNTTGNQNSFLGYEAGYHNTTGTQNSFLGYNSGFSNTTGFYNTFIGDMAGTSNTTGHNNTFLGSTAGSSHRTGSGNTFLGALTGSETSWGSNNVFVGYNAGLSTTGGSLNTYVGVDATTTGAYTNCTSIGYNTRVFQNNQVFIGNSSIVSAQIPVSWTVTSDARFKKDIESNVAGLSFIRLLRPVTYHYDVAGLARHLREDERMDTATKTMKRVEPDAFIRASREAKSKILQTGFLAQEVETASKSIGYDFSGVDKPQNEGGVYGLRYAEFTVPLVKAVQELDAENRQLKADVAVLKQQVAQLLKSVPTK